MKVARSVSGALLVTAFVACSGADRLDEATGTERSAIQGGTTTTSYPFVVGLSLPGGARCSGALIAPNLVMTARHCIDDTIHDPANPNAQNIDCAKSRFGAALGDTQVQATTCANMASTACTRWYRAAKILRTPGTAFCGADMALVILASNVPATEATPVTPAVQVPIHDARYTHSFTAIGYGITSPTANDSGLRRVLQSVEIGCVPGHRQTSRDCNQDPNLASIITPKEFVGGDGTCEGDSGSSPFEQNSFNAGAPLSFGVLSRGGESQGKCVGSIWTRADSMRDFIIAGAKEAATRGGYAVPTWTVLPPDPTDGGTTPSTDAGQDRAAPKPPPTGSVDVGQACADDAECRAGACVAPSTNGAKVCAASCTDTSACATGYSCVSGACFVNVAAPPPPAATTITTKTGCTVGAGVGAGREEPGKPIPWAAALLGAWILALARLRQPRAAGADRRK